MTCSHTITVKVGLHLITFSPRIQVAMRTVALIDGFSSSYKQHIVKLHVSAVVLFIDK